MIRLGDIEYSNCFPVHARLIEEGAPPGITLVRGTPGELNAALAAGRIDVAPCSSIEYARHAGEYALLPGLAIASTGRVGSILLESAVEPAQLDTCTVAVPTASATSVVLLRALLELRWRVRPKYEWFDQEDGADPLGRGASAALRIGDIALRRSAPAGRILLDLGEAWTEWTGLPFVYALWQLRRASLAPDAVARLNAVLHDSYAWFLSQAQALAERYAARFGMSAPRLLAYWRSLRYEMDARLEAGLMRFYALAASLGEAPVPVLEWAESRPARAT